MVKQNFRKKSDCCVQSVTIFEQSEVVTLAWYLHLSLSFSDDTWYLHLHQDIEIRRFCNWYD